MESDDPIVRDYRDALKSLQFVAAGKISLGVDDPAPGVGAPEYKAPDRVFDECTLKDFGR